MTALVITNNHQEYIKCFECISKSIRFDPITFRSYCQECYIKCVNPASVIPVKKNTQLVEMIKHFTDSFDDMQKKLNIVIKLEGTEYLMTSCIIKLFVNNDFRHIVYSHINEHDAQMTYGKNRVVKTLNVRRDSLVGQDKLEDLYKTLLLAE